MGGLGVLVGVVPHQPFPLGGFRDKLGDAGTPHHRVILLGVEDAVLVDGHVDYLGTREAVYLPPHDIPQKRLVRQGGVDKLVQVQEQIVHVGVELAVGLLLQGAVVLQEERNVVLAEKGDNAVGLRHALLVDGDVLVQGDGREGLDLGGDLRAARAVHVGGLGGVKFLVLGDYLALEEVFAATRGLLQLGLQGVDDGQVLGYAGDVGLILLCDGLPHIQQNVLVVDNHGIDTVLSVRKALDRLLEGDLALGNSGVAVPRDDGVLRCLLFGRLARVGHEQKVIGEVGSLRLRNHVVFEQLFHKGKALGRFLELVIDSH